MDNAPITGPAAQYDNAFSTFRSFQDAALAAELADRLQAAGIPVRLMDASAPIAPFIIGTTSDDFIQVQVLPRDFPKADALLDELARTQQHQIPDDYYLYSFSREELEDVLRKPDEWNALDVRLAQQLLQQQGVAVSEEKLSELRQERNASLSQPESLSGFWKAAGVLFTLVLSPAALFWGLAICYYRKTLPDGRKVYAYDAPARRFGGWMALISFAFIALRLAMRIYLDLTFFGWNL